MPFTTNIKLCLFGCYIEKKHDFAVLYSTPIGQFVE